MNNTDQHINLPSPAPKVSLIMPCRNEEKYIGQVIKDLLDQDYPSDCIEIIIADGRSEDQTRAIIEKAQKEHGNIRLIDNPQKVVPFALNNAIQQSTGEYIVRIDAHCEYPKNYVSRLVAVHASLDAANTGGMWVTVPGNESFKAYAISIAISTGFGVGNAYYRIGKDELTEVDTVPFGCFKRSLFNEIGLFDEELIRNQDDEFNARIIESGGKIILVPDLKITYYARESISKMMKMFYQYGLFKPLVNKKISKPATTRQLVPFLFTTYLVFLWPVSLIHSILAILYDAGLAAYLLLNVYNSMKLSASLKKPALMIYLPLIFFLIHISYGWGYIRGLVRFRLSSRGAKSLNFDTNR